MKPSIVFEANRTLIREIVLAHNALNPRVFGSVMKGCDTESSDLDLLIEPTPDTTLFDIGAIRHELIKLLGVLGIFRPKTTKCSGGRAVRGLQRGITFR
ncbi:nucleotidyltransferase family protein [Proteus mirabilis]|uniref:nucleotidyltransferase family protein n=1 Tax=Proteus mirabilis TaxID=584 RepID=UPI0034D78FAD|nr:nucleotidyltransferase [Vibrio cholerae]